MRAGSIWGSRGGRIVVGLDKVFCSSFCEGDGVYMRVSEMEW